MNYREHLTYYILAATLLFLVILECCTLSYWNYSSSRDWAAIVHFFSGICIALIPIFKINFPCLKGSKVVWMASLFMCLVLVIFAFTNLPGIFQKNPLDYRRADMLPIMQVMGERWLSGESVYAIIPEIWGGMQPIYLPAMWLPFVPAIALGIDIRWVNIALLLLGIFLLFFSPKTKAYNALSFLAFLPISLLIWYFIKINSNFLTLSEEAVVAGWYMLLGFALLRKSAWLLALSLVLCLLSRYVLLFWIPAYLLFVWLCFDKRMVWKTILYTAIGGLGLMAISQGLGVLDIFIGLRGNYLDEITDPNKIGSFTALIDRSIGLARLVPYERLPLLFYTQIGLAILIPWLFLFTFLRKKAQLNPLFFGICSLKLSLVFFYNLLIMPYTYLFYTSVFLSIYILFSFLTISTPSFSKLNK